MHRRVPQRAAFFVVIATGLLVGMALRSALTPPIDRGARMVAMFEEWCIPLLSGMRPEPDAVLVPFNAVPRAAHWLDPASALMLEKTARSCSVSDAPRLLSEQDRATVTAQVKDRVALWAPALRPGKPRLALDFDAFFFWDSTEDVSDPSRWGILLSRARKTGEDADTSLTLSLPKELRG